jgi:hypothetical protein
MPHRGMINLKSRSAASSKTLINKKLALEKRQIALEKVQ